MAVPKSVPKPQSVEFTKEQKKSKTLTKKNETIFFEIEKTKNVLSKTVTLKSRILEHRNF